MKEFILGLGTNRGDRAAYLRQAIRGIRKFACIAAISPVYESDALLPEGAPADWAIPYYNLALEIRTNLDAPALLGHVKNLEKRMGRKSAERWAPREIDIDILWMKNGSYRSEELTIPHPELGKRPFALLPLLDLAPRHPDREQAGDLRLTAEPWIGRDPERIPFRTRRVNIALCELIGILNLTPDSFSDGGRFLDPESARAQALKLLDEGASVLDLGGESTRPGATPISEDEEWRRIEPVLEKLAPLLKQRRASLSLDTRHALVAQRALALGPEIVSWINDVSGFEHESMLDTVQGSSCKLVVMHSLTIPADPKITLPEEQDPVSEVGSWFDRKLKSLEKSGISPDRVILDPGVGFGKTPTQSLRLLRGVQELRERGRLDEKGIPLLIGHSRKSFISAFSATSAKTPQARDLETAVASALLAQAGVEYLRVHDVQSSLRAIFAKAQLI